jgi:hypothetical protein
VSLRERPTRAFLQVALEPPGRARIRERDRDDERPGSMMNRHACGTGVVRVQAPGDFARESDVVAIRMQITAEDVDEAARFHAGDAAGTRPGSIARERVKI